MAGARSGLAVALAALALALDQWTKAIVRRDLGPGSPGGAVTVVGDWFVLAYGENRGVAFGLLRGVPDVLPLIAGVILGGVVAYAVRHRFRTWTLAVGTGLVVGGAVGNVVDRLRLGFVVDFVAIGPWPAFNVADAAVSVGVVLLVVEALAPASGASTRVEESTGG